MTNVFAVSDNIIFLKTGLPKEHAATMGRVRTEFHGDLVKHLEQSSLKG